jgi:chorismate synthase
MVDPCQHGEIACIAAPGDNGICTLHVAQNLADMVAALLHLHFTAVLHAAINEVRTRGESCGGEVTCVVRGVPKGLGSPVFDKLEAELAKAMLSLPATKVGGST